MSGAACSSPVPTFTGDDKIRSPEVGQGTASVSDAASAAARTLASFLNRMVRKVGQNLVVADDAQETLLTVDRADGTLRIRWISNPRESWTIPADGETTFSNLSRDGRLAAVTTTDGSPGVGQNRLTVWDVSLRRMRSAVPLRAGYIRAAWFGPDHSIVVSSYPLTIGETSAQARLDLYDAGGAHVAASGPMDVLPTGTVTNEFSFNPRTREYLAAAGSGNSGDSGYLAWKPGEPARAVNVRCNGTGVFSPDGDLFACPAGPENVISVWDATSHQALTQWTGQGSPSRLNSGKFTFLAGSRGLAVEDGRLDGDRKLVTRIHLYNLRTHAVVGEYALEPMVGLSDLVATQYGGTRSLVYGVPDPADSGEVAYYVFPSPSIP